MGTRNELTHRAVSSRLLSMQDKIRTMDLGRDEVDAFVAEATGQTPGGDPLPYVPSRSTPIGHQPSAPDILTATWSNGSAGSALQGGGSVTSTLRRDLMISR